VFWLSFCERRREAEGPNDETHEKGLERYAFNEDYWNHDLYPKIEDFYMNKFLPEAIVAIEKQRAYDPNVKVTKKKAVHI
jgi:hypothetical protein